MPRSLRIALLTSLGLLAQAIAMAAPPQILQIFREPLKPASEAAYDAIEVETARLAGQLGCPNPYLAAQTLSGSKEVWWFNAYSSPARQQEVFDAYANNTRLMDALRAMTARKKSLTLAPIDLTTTYLPALSSGNAWTLGEGRFLVVTVTTEQTHDTGTVFEAPDGTRFVVRAANTREQAEAVRKSSGPDTKVLAVRPSWSFPAKEWIAMDAVFWQQRSDPEIRP